jgi:hypothetical protein
VEPVSENECKVTYIIQADLGGWLPFTAANTVNQYLPLGIIGNTILFHSVVAQYSFVFIGLKLFDFHSQYSILILIGIRNINTNRYS